MPTGIVPVTKENEEDQAKLAAGAYDHKDLVCKIVKRVTYMSCLDIVAELGTKNLLLLTVHSRGRRNADYCASDWSALSRGTRTPRNAFD